MSSKSYRTKKALANSLKVLIDEQKFERISVESICTLANVTRRNFYHHFRDKYDLLNWIYDQDFHYDFSEHPDWTIADYFPLFCQRVYENRSFYLKAYQITGQNGFREHSHDWLYPLLHKDFKDCFYSEEQEKLVLEFSSYLTFDCIIEWLKAEPCVPAKEFTKSHMEGIALYFKKCANLFTDVIEHHPLLNDAKDNPPQS